MEEHILKILKTHWTNHEYPFANQEKAAKVITFHVMKFAIWFACDSFEDFEQGTDDQGNNQFFDMEGNEVTPEIIYKYWFNNVYKSK